MIDEPLPEVGKRYKLSTDLTERAIGGTSGAIAGLHGGGSGRTRSGNVIV